MFKALVIVVLGAVVGLFAGWTAHKTRYGAVAKFGPFSLDNGLDATEVIAALKSKAQAGSPQIEVVGGEEYDFGVMEPGTKGEHQFVVRNVGGYPLSLEIIGSTCKCTLGKLEKSSIGPGEETHIQMTWDVKTTAEDFSQSAILKTNDPTRGELNLIIKGRAINQMTMVPRSFSFGEIESGEVIKLESLVYSFEKEPIVATSQKFSDEAMTALAKFDVKELSVEPAKDDPYSTATQAFKVSCEIQSGLPQGAVQQNFLFNYVKKSAVDAEGKYDESRIKTLSASIAGRIVGAITMVESSKCYRLEGGNYVYTIGRVDPVTASPERAHIILRGKFKDSMKISLGEVEPAELLKAELGEPVGRGALLLYPLKLWIAPGAKSGERSGRNEGDYGVIWIKTDNPEVAPLRLKVRFAVAK